MSGNDERNRQVKRMGGYLVGKRINLSLNMLVEVPAEPIVETVFNKLK